MQFDIEFIGRDWTIEQFDAFTEDISRMSPSEFSEAYRYLPESVSAIPGPMSFDVNPFMKEIVDRCDVEDPAREVSLMKGAQITYTTGLETIILYGMAHIKTVPMMYMTADLELAKARMDASFVPMINDSGFNHLIRSADTLSKRKTGKTSKHLQWDGGGSIYPFGAKNADKMRNFSIAWMLKDELDAWPETVGADGDPDSLSDERTAGYNDTRKIFRGSTPLIKELSKIYRAYKRGDQRKYKVRCLRCGFPQALRWSGENKETRKLFGVRWELQNGILMPESVHYACENCGHAHFEHDKENLFSLDCGAEWVPTATPQAQYIYSYHLPALYSPVGMRPWHRCVLMYLDGWDVKNKRVRDIGKYQVFYNNILAWPFTVQGSKVEFESVSAHRRPVYRFGEVPNGYATQYSGSRILFLTCTVDVHKYNLAVSVIGWCRDGRNYLIDYWRFNADDDGRDPEENLCEEISSSCWGRLRILLEEHVYVANDGQRYRVAISGIDANYNAAVVSQFCGVYEQGVYPIVGRETVGKKRSIREFAEYETQSGLKGYQILVDHYKERIAPVLRREWHEDSGPQRDFHFNAPVDATDAQLKELTREVRRERTNDQGYKSYVWYRPGNARQELWDLLVYGHAMMEIMAWQVCVEYYEMDQIDWPKFWDYAEGQLTTP